MATFAEDFAARFPEIAQADIDAYMPVLELAWPAYFGGNYTETTRELILNLVAHLMMAEKSAGQGAIQAEASTSVGSVSVSYRDADSSGMAEFFGATKYGQRYLLLLRFRGGGRFV